MNWQPSLIGKRLHLRPLRSEDFEALFRAASDPLIWEQHSAQDRHQRPAFERFFQGALESGGALVAVDPSSGRIIGSSRFYDWNPKDSSVVIGYSFLERAYWGTGMNREMKDLMLAHAFTSAKVVWFHVSPGNLRSQRALEKLGARLDHPEDVLVAGVMSPRLIYKLNAPSHR